jgi:hypothetical protein
MLPIAEQYREVASIIFVGPANLKRYVENEGWRYHVLSLQYFQTPINVDRFWKGLGTIFRPVKQRAEYFAECNELRSVLHVHNPGLVFFDSFLVVFHPVLKERGVRCASVQTMFPTQRSKNIPPLNCHFIPGDTILSSVVSDMLWHRRSLYNWCINVFIKFSSANRFHLDLMKSLAAYAKDDYCFQTWLTPTIDAIPEVVTSPSSLNFPWYQPRANQLFAGFRIYQRKEYLQPEVAGFVAKATRPGNKFIYCSFGTIVAHESELISQFILKLIALAKGSPSWYFAIKAKDVQMAAGLPNIHIADEYPQLAMLREADVMVSHGGLNSLNECIWFEVPMLIYPIDRRSDRGGNAARVVYHNIGDRGKIKTDSIETIRKKISNLLCDEEIKSNLRTIKSRGLAEALNNCLTNKLPV